MASTMQRILTRLCRAAWVERLPEEQRGDLAVAAADVGDGRAAEELLSLAAAWREVARHDGVSRSIARLYSHAAGDLEIRAAALRGVPKIRTLVAERPELGVAAAAVEVEKLTVDHEVALQVVLPTTVATVRALAAWCDLLMDLRVHLVVEDPAEACVTVTGVLHDCGLAVAGALDGADPVIGRFVAHARAQRGPGPAVAVESERMQELADELATGAVSA